ncbi:hypothetical protein NC653_039651 [Populus alba x Populus x berolinensis]|uniref:Uncharacterized protein n=1 Tax=Populus alba x Populus x berolinensis TaxID=444605 RepID=A0AAD6LBR0_9ROSI|nr:hypothetical protein NC653_039651 [Populus alba x Populus x berolinensis]
MVRKSCDIDDENGDGGDSVVAFYTVYVGLKPDIFALPLLIACLSSMLNSSAVSFEACLKLLQLRFEVGHRSSSSFSSRKDWEGCFCIRFGILYKGKLFIIERSAPNERRLACVTSDKDMSSLLRLKLGNVLTGFVLFVCYYTLKRKSYLELFLKAMVIQPSSAKFSIESGESSPSSICYFLCQDLLIQAFPDERVSGKSHIGKKGIIFEVYIPSPLTCLPAELCNESFSAIIWPARSKPGDVLRHPSEDLGVLAPRVEGIA